jgi:hypothetical protein
MMMALGFLGTADFSEPNASISTDKGYYNNSTSTCDLSLAKFEQSEDNGITGKCPCVQGLTQFALLIFWTPDHEPSHAPDWDTVTAKVTARPQLRVDKFLGDIFSSLHRS